MDQIDYVSAREAMIDSQIHPMGVVNEALLEAFARVPREDYFPENKKGISYCDEDVEFATGRFLMEPSVCARLIQAVDPQPHEVALAIGSGAGYTASILSLLTSTVIALEEEKEFIHHAQNVWNRLGYCNIAAAYGPLQQGAPVNAPYDIIIFNGAITEIPREIKEQLADNGRLVAVVRKDSNSIGKATLVQKIGTGSFSERILFDAGTPFLDGFKPRKKFVF